MKHTIGNDEYNFYKTYDNGRSWSIFYPYDGAASLSYQRIIIYGNNNNGLKYTDDNFATIKNSNINDGSWEAVLPNSKDVLYASSKDGRGIYKSVDNGETWTLFSYGSGNKIDNSIIHGSGTDIVVIGPSGKPTYDNESVYDPNQGEIKSPINKDGYGDPLLYILNKIIVPKLSSMLTGDKDLPGVRLSSEKFYPSIFTKEDLYDVSFDGIDFVSDVGMRPIKASDINEYKNTKQEADNILVKTEEEKVIEELDYYIKSNPVLQKTFSIIDMYLKINKEFLRGKNIESIFSKKEYYEKLSDPKDRESMKMYYDVQKGTMASLSGTIVNYIFTFSNSKKMALLKSSILKTAYNIKDPINLKINSIKEKLKAGYTPEMIINSNSLKSFIDMDLKKEWKTSLEECIMEYYLTVVKNINRLTEKNDKDLIFAAANKYNSERQELINKVSPGVYNLIQREPTEFIKNLDSQISSKLNDIIKRAEALYEKYKNNIINTEDFKEALNGLYIEYEGFEKSFDTITIRNDFGAVYDDLRVQLINYIKEEVSPATNNLYFTQEEYDEQISFIPSNSIDKVYDYLREIINRFKERCIDLLDVVGNELIDIILANFGLKEDLRIWMDTLINKKPSKPPYTGTYASDEEGLFVSLVIDNWNNKKDII